jgi:integrase
MSRYGEGSITERGDSFRLRYRVDGKRYTKTVTGSLTDAKRDLRKILTTADKGTHVAPVKVTVAQYIKEWLDSDTDLSPKTVERYRQLAQDQIGPHLGTTPLQTLRPDQIDKWHKALLKGGGTRGGPLSARTVGHAHRLLHRALARAVTLEVLSRNVASVVHPPKVDAEEIEILTSDQIAALLSHLEGHQLLPIVSLALGTGMRRGELCALAWGAVDLEKATVRVERSLEETDAAGLRFKTPKTRSGRRTISLAASTVDMLRAHRKSQLELRLKLALGKLDDDDLVFAKPDGSPYPPDDLSRDWGVLVRRKGLPHVTIHALRHTHASMLIAAALDVVSVSKRLGHASPTVTLGIYAHLFHTSDARAADAIEKVLR